MKKTHSFFTAYTAIDKSGLKKAHSMSKYKLLLNLTSESNYEQFTSLQFQSCNLVR
uniref:Uncharacterized protein n=1 Tax=Anguilla anguilla TaxID=7936 RepID=A0A0E9W2S0_ANGAN